MCVAVAPANLAANWWTVPVLCGLAVMNGVLEEVVMLGFLFNRLGRMGWVPAAYLLASALIRGTYHLYQGFGPTLGNLVMGLVFVWLYRRGGRLMPLLIAHALLDTVGFLAPQLLAG